MAIREVQHIKDIITIANLPQAVARVAIQDTAMVVVESSILICRIHIRDTNMVVIQNHIHSSLAHIIQSKLQMVKASPA